MHIYKTTMKRRFSLCALLLVGVAAFSQSNDWTRPWHKKLFCEKDEIRMRINLYEESIDVPGMDMFGPMSGYMNGKVYGVWMLTSHTINSDKEATLRLSNDLGSETQECLLTQVNDSIYKLELKHGVSIKKVIKNKLVKIPSTLEFKVEK